MVIYAVFSCIYEPHSRIFFGTSLMSLFIQTAHAAGEAAPAGPSALANLVMVGAFVLIFYFMIWRPQSKRQKEHVTMLESIKEGSEVIFAGGLMGKVKSLTEDYAVISLNDKTDVTIQKSAVISVLPAGTIEGVSQA